jgi:glycosyltransferase involved in cell wall biosynthesis
MRKIPCSIPILTLNSEKHLKQCLESVKDFDDAFLVDGNSTDKTLEIAKEFGVKVYKQVETDEPNVKIKNFTEVRIKAFNLTKYDWYLDLDSDEYLSENLVKKIREIIEGGTDINFAFNVPKKYIIRGKIIEHAFNYPSYNPRLFNKKSGIKFFENKAVHEDFFIPQNIKIINLKENIYSRLPDSYKKCVEKDNYYLKLALEAMSKKRKKKQTRPQILWISLKYFLRALKIAMVSIALYFRYGYKKCLPIPYWWRHVRYHLLVGFYKLKSLLL